MDLREPKALTYEGEIAHEADGITVGCGSPLRPNLFSPECPTRGLPQGGKPTICVVNCPSNNDSAFRCRKAKRISESKLHGIVSYNLRSIVEARGAKARGWWDLLIGSSTVTNNPAGLRSRIRLRRMWCYRNWDMLLVALPRLAATEVPTRPTIQGGRTGVWRATKDSGPSQGSG